jgi:hypothetical protein
MTDGHATVGSTETEDLITLIDPTISSSFIAFGIEHNSKMLNAFGQVSSKTSNWLVENLEKAGLVYGEIINNELYVGADDVKITLYNGLIYDYTKDEFVETLDVNTLVTESKKLYHVVTQKQNHCYAIIRGTVSLTGEQFEDTVPMLPDLETSDGDLVENDLTQHLFRLRAQQLMKIALSDEMQQYDSLYEFPRIHHARGGIRRQNAVSIFTQDTYVDNSEPLQYEHDNVEQSSETVVEAYHDNHVPPVNPASLFKNSLKEFQKTLETYMKDNSLEDDSFMQSIRDDIYITAVTMNNLNQHMYVSARQSSQGRQRSYNVTEIDVPEDQFHDNVEISNVTSQRHLLSRSHTNTSYTTPTMMRTMTNISQT